MFIVRDKLNSIQGNMTIFKAIMKTIQGKRYTVYIWEPEDCLPRLDNWEYERLKATDKARFSSLIECRSKNALSNRIWAKLLLQNSNELKPDFLLIEETEKFFIGVEESIFVLDVSSGKVLSQQKLFAPFLTFYHTDMNAVVALCELEVFVFDNEGQFRWGRSFPDVLSEIFIQDDVMEIAELFGDTYWVDLLTGKMIIPKLDSQFGKLSYG